MILLTGASGFLGKILFRVFSRRTDTVGICFTSTACNSFLRADITDTPRLLDVLDYVKPSCIVHSAAWRDPDRCEHDPGGARKLHVDASAHMVEWCAGHDCSLVYISTDYVFDGTNPPYGESDPVSPVSVYGRTKAEGECVVQTLPNHIIARIPLQYGFSQVPDDSFILKVLERLSAGNPVELDDYQLRYPTLGDDVAAALLNLSSSGYRGTIHLCGETAATRYEMWKIIADVFGYDNPRIFPAPHPVTHAAARPKDSRLSTERYASLGLPPFHSFRDGLQYVMKQMQEYGYEWK